jgi:hypothetical protein
MLQGNEMASVGGGAGESGEADVPPVHPAHWWAQFLELSDHFDAAWAVEEFGDLVVPRVPSALLRREVEIATASVSRYLAKPASVELGQLAEAAMARLDQTLNRMKERSLGTASMAEADAMVLALRGEYAAAASAAEAIVGTSAVQLLVITAMRLERFDIALTVRLLDDGRSPAESVRSGALVGQYRWWPAWLRRITTERALAGTLDENAIAALDKCAYASLSSLQAQLARRLLSGNPRFITDAAKRLDGMGETDAAQRLRDGDLSTVALAVRLMSP